MGAVCENCTASADDPATSKITLEWRKAVNNGDVAKVAALNQQHPDSIIESTFPDGDRAIHKAIRRDDKKMIFFLLDCGADPNAPDISLNTPLHLAAEANNYNLASLLMHQFANPTLKNADNLSPQDIAEENRSAKMKQLLEVDDDYLKQAEEIRATHYPENNGWETAGGEADDADEREGYDSWVSEASDSGDEEPVSIFSRSPSFSARERTNWEMYKEWREENKLDGRALVSYLDYRRELEEKSNDQLLAAGLIQSAPLLGNSREGRRRSGGYDNTYSAPISSATDSSSRRPDKGAMKSQPSMGWLMLEDEKQQEKVPLTSQEEEYETLKLELAKRGEELAQVDLSRWLKKRRPKAPYTWQDRWVIVRNSYILWSQTQIDTQHPNIPRERKRFNQALSFVVVQRIEAVTEGKGQRKFKIIVKSHRGNVAVREYVFKAKTQRDRDHWVEQLNKHKQFYDDMMAFHERKH